MNKLNLTSKEIVQKEKSIRKGKLIGIFLALLLIGVIASVVTMVFNWLFNLIDISDKLTVYKYKNFEYNADGSVIAGFVTGVLTIFLSLNVFNVVKNNEEKVSALGFFKEFNVNNAGWKIVGAFILINTLVFFGTLLFVIPGIILMYMYSHTFYLLHDRPEMGVLDAMKESVRRMKGNKGKLFGLQMRYMFWIVLGFIVSLIALIIVLAVSVMSIFMVGSIISPIYLPLVGILTMVLAVVLYIQTIKLILANAVFHNEIDLINSSERKVENVTESDAIEVKE